LTLSLIVAVFLIPLVAAYLYYLYRPVGESGNYGTLVEPPRPLQEFRMTDLEGNPAGLDALKGKWTLLYVGGTECGEPCRQGLFNIERVRLTQGDEMERVQSLYLAPASLDSRVIEERLVEYEGLRGYTIAPGELEAMAPGFDWAGATGPGEAERVYVIDPLGNLMMFYPGGAEPTGMKKDLKRLLKVSQIG
jgi:cytochrome oxidase Cu insertion factor (SCO1/SenC/PrrC family)